MVGAIQHTPEEVPHFLVILEELGQRAEDRPRFLLSVIVVVVAAAGAESTRMFGFTNFEVAEKPPAEAVPESFEYAVIAGPAYFTRICDCTPTRNAFELTVAVTEVTSPPAVL